MIEEQGRVFKALRNLHGFSAPEESYMLLQLLRCGVIDRSAMHKLYKYLNSLPAIDNGKQDF